MKLYATPLSHFSRKIRLLLDHYAQAYEVIDVGNVAEGAKAKFADNPLMRVPVLVDQGEWLIESDHIAAYLARKLDPRDAFEVHTTDPASLNIRAVLNGIMLEEVKVILAKRTQVPVEQYAFFDKALEAMREGLAWLETKAAAFTPDAPKYREFHLVCLWDHLEYYGLLPLEPYGRLREVAAQVSSREKVKRSAPQVLKPR